MEYVANDSFRVLFVRSRIFVFHEKQLNTYLSLEYIYLPKVVIFATGVEMKARKYTQFKKLCN